jgi:hypothetical protein
MEVSLLGAARTSIGFGLGVGGEAATNRQAELIALNPDRLLARWIYNTGDANGESGCPVSHSTSTRVTSSPIARIP